MDSNFKKAQPETSSKDPNDLRSALEYQIDIVLRLEEERLLLLKENKTQKEKIRELTSKCNDLESKKGFHRESKAIQASIDNKANGTQTDEVKVLNPSEYLMLATKAESTAKTEKLIDEASEYVKRYSDLSESQMSIQSSVSKKKATSSKMSQSQKTARSEKENLNSTMNMMDDKNTSYAAENLRQEKNILTEELINLNKEVARLRTENRILNENAKKGEKEKSELKKSLQARTDMVEKLKKENNDLSVLMTRDQFKTVRMIESELKKVVGHNKSLIDELQVTRNEKIRLENELNDFKMHLDKLTEDIELKCKEDADMAELKREKDEFEEKVRDLEKALEAKQEELAAKEKSVQEMQVENVRLANDVDYFKNIAQTSKTFAEKAIADVEVYRKMLEKAQSV